MFATLAKVCSEQTLQTITVVYSITVHVTVMLVVHIPRDQIYVDVGKMPDYARGEGVVDSDDDSEDSDAELGK